MSELPPHDPDALFQARAWIRMAYIRVRQLRQEDPTVRCIATKLNDLCIEITEAMELENPRLPFAEKQTAYEAHRKSLREEWTAPKA